MTNKILIQLKGRFPEGEISEKKVSEGIKNILELKQFNIEYLFFKENEKIETEVTIEPFLKRQKKFFNQEIENLITSKIIAVFKRVFPDLSISCGFSF